MIIELRAIEKNLIKNRTYLLKYYLLQNRKNRNKTFCSGFFYKITVFQLSLVHLIFYQLNSGAGLSVIFSTACLKIFNNSGVSGSKAA